MKKIGKIEIVEAIRLIVFGSDLGSMKDLGRSRIGRTWLVSTTNGVVTFGGPGDCPEDMMRITSRELGRSRHC